MNAPIPPGQLFPGDGAPARRVLAAGGISVLAAALMLVTSGCGQDPAPAPPAEVPALPLPPRLTLLAMEDFIGTGILERFARETGVTIEHVTYDEADAVGPRLQSMPGSADLVIVDSFTIKTLSDLRLLRPLDKQSLTNLDNIDPRHRGLSFDPRGDYSIPYHWGTTLIAYRRDHLPSPLRSWRLLWQPELKGRVMMLNDSFEPMAVAMILNHVDPQTPTKKAFADAADFLIDHLQTQRARYGTDDEIKEALVAGTVSAAMCYSGDAAVAAEENPHIDFFIPEEGAMMWVDCLAICRDTRSSEACHRFIDFFLRPEIAALNAAAINYAPANHAAEALVPDELKNDPRVYPPPEIRAKLQHVPNLDDKREAMSRRYWHRIRRQALLLDESVQSDGKAPAAPAEAAVRTTP